MTATRFVVPLQGSPIDRYRHYHALDRRVVTEFTIQYEAEMNRLFEEKYDELFTEFNRYVVEHPAFSKRIPADALVVLLDKNDPVFNRENLRRVKKYLKHDDQPHRPVVYVQV
ncbi:MAG: hypothetical protein HYY33_07400, partial [Chloroflexi bacterium]|nr:hypothetical protein [Chloroflexota bacterium]